MTRRLPALVLAVLLIGATAGCRSQQEKYCDALRADQAKLGEITNSGRNDALIVALPVFTELAGKAPDDLTDEWQTLLNAITGLREALKAAGVKPTDFEGSRIPDSVQGQARTDLVAAADAVSSAATLSAATGIETQARDVCQVNIGL